MEKKRVADHYVNHCCGRVAGYRRHVGHLYRSDPLLCIDAPSV